jgi:plastocyanin
MKKHLAVPALAIFATAAMAVPAGAAVKIRVADDVFKPSSKTVDKGTRVKWKFVGDNPHNVTVTSGPREFRSGTKSSGKFVKKMRKRGTYKIVCTIHPGMDMTLKVD